MNRLKGAMSSLLLSLRNSWRTFLRKRVVFPQVGRVNFGDFSTTNPVGEVFGSNRGPAIDRYYIETFLNQYADLIHDDVLEIAEDRYASRFGGAALRRVDTLGMPACETKTTIIGDLRGIPEIPDATYDCVILTQTLQFIFEAESALREVCRILKPGGTALITVPSISPISPSDRDLWGDYWRFTEQSMSGLLSRAFGKDSFRVSSYGNAYAATAFIQGLCIDDVDTAQLEHYDPIYPLVIVACSHKSEQMKERFG
ncbi:MAG: class I SAM-dependent methyltransferase [Actinomycetes bacterium]|jgi:hypothetical protein|nr:class I SAM-dependent methyltransferase [Actinomycetes bacterium]